MAVWKEGRAGCRAPPRNRPNRIASLPPQAALLVRVGELGRTIDLAVACMWSTWSEARDAEVRRGKKGGARDAFAKGGEGEGQNLWANDPLDVGDAVQGQHRRGLVVAVVLVVAAAARSHEEEDEAQAEAAPPATCPQAGMV